MQATRSWGSIRGVRADPPGSGGHAPSYKSLMDDIAHFLEVAATRFPDQPTFLYGVSMGGNLVLNYALRRRPKLKGVIAASSWLRLAYEPPSWKRVMGQIMATLWPTFSASTGEDPDAFSRDPDVVRDFYGDPLTHDRATARLYVEITEAARWALDHAHQFPLPLLVMHGSGDRTMSHKASCEFAQGVPANCTLKLWEGLYHDINNDPEQQAVFRFLIRWLQTQTTMQA